MNDSSRYLLVEKSVLPEVFERVVAAKRLLAQGKAKNLSEAARLSGISRSALYKYKDAVHSPGQSLRENIVTLYAMLEDEPGVLSAVMNELYRDGGNILTVNQNLPLDGVAAVSLSVRIDPQLVDDAQLLQRIGGIAGVVEVRLVASS